MGAPVKGHPGLAMSQPANRHAAMAVASVMAFALALAAGCALLWASPDRASLLVEQVRPWRVRKEAGN